MHYHQDAFNTLLHGEKHWVRGGLPTRTESAESCSH